MDAIEKEIKNIIEKERLAAGLGRRFDPAYPTEKDFYLFVTDNLSGAELDKMINHLKNHPEDQQLVATVRELLARLEEAQNETVPSGLLESVRSRIPQSGVVACPYCKKAITPFKKPLHRQKFLNLLWLAAGSGFFLLSFSLRRFFIQWTALGMLCVAQWIIDQKSTKTQIMIYKALSEEADPKARHLHRTGSHL